MTTYGWQQPPVRSKPKCAHIGLMFAALTLGVHPVGHTWRCACGKLFVVVSDGPNGPKKLEPASSA